MAAIIYLNRKRKCIADHYQEVHKFSCTKKNLDSHNYYIKIYDNFTLLSNITDHKTCVYRHANVHLQITINTEGYRKKLRRKPLCV